MRKAAAILKTLVLGVLSAQAVPVVFQGDVVFDPSNSGSYFVEFGVSDGQTPEPTFYTHFWDPFAVGGSTLSDRSSNFDFLQDQGKNRYTFQFTRDIADAFALNFSQNLESQKASLSFILSSPDRTVTITPDPNPLSLLISGLHANTSYFADISATDPFAGTLAISPQTSGAPEMDPKAASLPALFLFGALLAGRRRIAEKVDCQKLA